MNPFDSLLRKALAAVLLGALGGAACRTAAPDAPQAASAPPDSSHYRRFATADALLHYLRNTPRQQGLLSAHRGGDMPGYPENAIETFQHALGYAPCIIECDVQLSADSVLFMLHDDALDRTTTGSGPAKALPYDALRRLQLKDPTGQVTPYRIPRLSDVLRWAEGRAVLTVDPKRGVPLARIVREIQQAAARNRALLITYNLRQAEEAHRLDSTLLLSVSIGNLETWARFRASGIVRLDRVAAFVGTSEPEPALYDTLRAHRIPTILGTMGNLDRQAEARGDSVYTGLHRRGADILSTDRLPQAAAALQR